MPRAPDFAMTDAAPLTRRDVEFLLRHFPPAARHCEADGPAEYHYLYELAAAAQAPPHQEFLAHAQLGNYALLLAGVFPGWIEHRHRYARRPVGRDYYVNLGRAHFRQAAASHHARLRKPGHGFSRLIAGFEWYASALTRMTRDYLPGLAKRHGTDRLLPAHG